MSDLNCRIYNRKHIMIFFSLIIIKLSILQQSVEAGQPLSQLTNPEITSTQISLVSSAQSKDDGNQTFAFQYPNAFPTPPRISYCISQVEPNDNVTVQFFGMVIQQITNTNFTITVIVGDNTVINKLKTLVMIVDPKFSGNLNIFNNFPLDYYPNGTNPDPYTKSRNYSNTVNFTAQYINSTYNHFNQPLNNNRIILYITYLNLRYQGFYFYTLKVSPQVIIVSNNTYQISIDQGQYAGVNKILYSQLVIDVDEINSSGIYKLYIHQQDNQGIIQQMEKQFGSDFILGIVAFETNNPFSCKFKYTWSATDTGRMYKLTIQSSSELSCGLSYMGSIIVRIVKLGCAAPYYYYNSTTDLCQDQCGQLFYNIVENYTCGSCLYQCLQCSDNSTCISCNQNHNRVLNQSRCQCIKGYYDDYTNPQCVVCSSVLQFCLNCMYYNQLLNNLKYECFECNQVNKTQLYFGRCICMKGYYNDTSNSECKQCLTLLPFCIDCKYHNPQQNGMQYECFECQNNANRQVKQGSCACIKGYYDDSVSSQCQSCSAVLPYCVSCAYYDPQKNGMQYECFECQNNTNRQIKQGSCACIKGYYDDQVSPKCLHCSVVLPYCLNCVYHNQQKDGMQYECFECDQAKKLQNNACGQSLKYLNVEQSFNKLPESIKSTAKTVDAVNSIPMVRVLLKFMGPLFFCMDDYWFYLYHQVNYSNFTGISSFLITIVKIQSQKMVPSFFRSQILDKIDQMLNFTIFFSSDHSNYTTKEYKTVNESDLYLSRSFKEMIIWNYSTTILITLLLYLLYKLLDHLRVKKPFLLSLKQYLCSSTTIYALIQGLIESNLIFVVFECSANLRISFANNIYDKFNNSIVVVYFFISVFFSFCFYILFFNKFRKKIPDLLLTSMIYGSLFNIFNFTFIGFLHGFLMTSAEFQALALAVSKLLFSLLTIYFWKVFDQLLLCFLTLIYYLAGICIDLLIYFKMDSIQEDQTYIIQITLILIIISSVILKLLLDIWLMIWGVCCCASKAKITPSQKASQNHCKTKQKIRKLTQTQTKGDELPTNTNLESESRIKIQPIVFRALKIIDKLLTAKGQNPDQECPSSSVQPPKVIKMRIKLPQKRQIRRSRFLQVRPNGL